VYSDVPGGVFNFHGLSLERLGSEVMAFLFNFRFSDVLVTGNEYVSNEFRAATTY
jgi:hypothetical protein